MSPADWVGAREAAALLGVKRETLYVYVSRGLVRSIPEPGGARARLYSRDDLERLHTRSTARRGHGVVAAGALRFGEPVLETAVGTVTAEGPVYRGRLALALEEEGATFEDVCALLWDAPPEAEGRGQRDALHLGGRALLGPAARPFDAMLVAAALVAARERPIDAGRVTVARQASSLIRALVAAAGHPIGAAAASLAGSSTAEGLLVSLGRAPTARARRAIDGALVLSADHELNASTFAARIAASTRASLPAAIVAALATLSGSLHGAATARVEALLDDVHKPERALDVVTARLERGEAVPGFGHPLYPAGDPRGARLLARARELAPRSRVVRTAAAVCSAMDHVAGERPTLDVGLVALAAALGLPRGSALVVFASGRLAGWVAHVLEQREAGHILRPRARYVGPRPALA